MAVSVLVEADLQHMSKGAAFPGAAIGLLGAGSVHCGPLCSALGSCPVSVDGEVVVAGAFEGVPCCSRICGIRLVG